MLDKNENFKSGMAKFFNDYLYNQGIKKITIQQND